MHPLSEKQCLRQACRVGMMGGSIASMDNTIEIHSGYGRRQGRRWRRQAFVDCRVFIPEEGFVAPPTHD